MSLQDQIYDMEEFLRSECGSILDLIPSLGSRPGNGYEVQISHETFQAYLTDPSKPRGDVFAPSIPMEKQP
jgi:hypothetical protein